MLFSSFCFDVQLLFLIGRLRSVEHCLHGSDIGKGWNNNAS